MKFRKNDEVIVTTGQYKGRMGKIIKTDEKANKVWIKDINIVTKHNKPTQGQDGKITKFEAPIDASNIAVLVKKATKTSVAVYSKIGYSFNKDGKKIRINKRTKKEY
ncbi:50S ribosomal protein L24 [Mycoplasma sp. Mirounga ES2805-ORL]|uniref:50S ribosomal protein L24 n=1 Tax=Mycoplasma sp. Mirounga ES2805-ORL TaxID=754514 RepID=UPI00197B6566|nr:50S ribosomal protein L24 [Mycoplasma sp. Mirounga ES2805-ORL]QSF13954.1 50S ribosomal protein L24 [Mycoplasma sp. Mirounga ES2805-ORL]